MLILYMFGIANAIAAGFFAYRDMSRRGVQKTLYHSMLTVLSVVIIVVAMIEA